MSDEEIYGNKTNDESEFGFGNISAPVKKPEPIGEKIQEIEAKPKPII
jgi:hypothetical protein